MNSEGEIGLCRMHAIVHGRVQGVNFRAATMMVASDLQLRGWVRNRPDGTVETTCEGSREKVERFVAYLHQGPPAANVTYLDLEWTEPQGNLGRFEIRHF